MTEELQKARDYELEADKKIEAAQRPLLHLSSRSGWMNDPNGFSYYQGKYHMFYQYHPYSNQWGPMHWGHAASSDLLSWEYLPAALAPDMPYDKNGCFSGSAIELEDGRQLIIYTGVRKEEQAFGEAKDIQVQCIAIGDGVNYEKYEDNPVITEKDIPKGASIYDFRDPKIWYENGSYYCVAGNCTEDRDGQILLFRSKDAMNWKFDKVLVKNNKRFGCMWECPDFFELDKKRVLITSPQDMLPEDLEFHNGNGTLCIIGDVDDEGNFTEENCHAIDYGIDFYAPQTVLAPDGRRIMIGWMQNWDTIGHKAETPFYWFGQMSLPRELSIKDGRLIQKPVRELEKRHVREVTRKNVRISGVCNLSGIQGRIIDMTLDIKPFDIGRMYRRFELRFADNGKNYSAVSYEPYESILKIDRKYSGTRKAAIHQRRCHVRSADGALKLRLILDKYSAEIFVNDGEQTMSMTLYTDTDADGINFQADGDLLMNVTMYEMR